MCTNFIDERKPGETRPSPEVVKTKAKGLVCSRKHPIFARRERCPNTDTICVYPGIFSETAKNATETIPVAPKQRLQIPNRNKLGA